MNPIEPHSLEIMRRAVELCRTREMTIRGASQCFNIPYSTLGDKVRGRRPIEYKQRTVLSMEDETKLAHWIFEMVRTGFVRNKHDIKDKVKMILDGRGQETKFKDNRPGKHWMAGFLSRQKDVAEILLQLLDKEWSIKSSESLKKWFDDFEHYVNQVDPMLLKIPDRIFKVNESAFSICPRSKKVQAPKEPTHLYKPSTSTGSQVTVLACSSASGEYLPPLMIFPYQRDPGFKPLKGFERAFFRTAENGWISAKVFLSWLRDVFIPGVEEKTKPVVLFVDGHTSLVSSVEMCEFCQSKGVLLYSLRAPSLHIMQPLDKAHIGILKTAWSGAAQKYVRKTGKEVTLQMFARVFAKAWKEAAQPGIAFASFAKSGLFPFNPSVVFTSQKLKAADDFASHPSHSPSQSVANASVRAPVVCQQSASQRESLIAERLNMLNEIVQMGLEENTQNIRRMKEGYCIPNPEYSRWKKLVLSMFGVTSPLISSLSTPSANSLQCVEPTTSREDSPCSHFTGAASMHREEDKQSSLSSTTTPHPHPTPSESADEIIAISPLPQRKSKIKSPCYSITISSSSTKNVLNGKMTRQKKGPEKEKRKRKCESEREVKKKVKEEAKERVKDMREKRKRKRQLEEEEKRKEKEDGKRLKEMSFSQKKKSVEDEVDDDDDDDIDFVGHGCLERQMDMTVDENDDSKYVDDRVDLQEVVLGTCGGCHGEEDHSDWVMCTDCNGWWHLNCVKNENIRFKTIEDLQNFDFFCDSCVGLK